MIGGNNRVLRGVIHMNEYYKKCKDELAEAIKVEEIASVEYKVASNTLVDYNKELEDFIETLKEKYDYDTKKIMCDEMLDKLSKARKVRQRSQVLLTLEVINRLVTHPLYKDRDAVKAWNWLNNKDIDYCNEYYSFDSLYEYIQKYGLDHVDFCGNYLGDDFYTVEDVRYFRGNTDRVKLEIPICIVENPEQFMNEVEELIHTAEVEEEKRKQEAEIAEKQRRREMYERLKAEFGT